MAATLRRTFRYPGEDDHHDGEAREELDEQGQISRPFLCRPLNIQSIYIACNGLNMLISK